MTHAGGNMGDAEQQRSEQTAAVMLAEHCLRRTCLPDFDAGAIAARLHVATNPTPAVHDAAHRLFRTTPENTFASSPKPSTRSKSQKAAPRQKGPRKAGVPKQRPRCEHSACSISASYGDATLRKAQFCAAHRLSGHVDVKNRPCEAAGCSRAPSFAHPTERRARFCQLHKGEGDVNVKDNKRRKTRLCRAAGCFKSALFAPPGGVAARCG
eukprot:CAMPEP_0177693420 /NCGR_PEP_ID=MMETSP0484_2-20121128/2390_1 /TAXON_ID=354590 /ORGANISM="Rhodomonas lens, Strain RHODO" /LENGTH=210 /DNA_ID=CAMNT_0019204229 /DNA_START=51 /DNA_END=680 /DNA_ORIENTATION=-